MAADVRNFKVRQKTVGVFPDTTISWKLSEIQPTRNMRRCWTRPGANSIPTPFQWRMSTGDFHQSNTVGKKLKRCEAPPIRRFSATHAESSRPTQQERA